MTVVPSFSMEIFFLHPNSSAILYLQIKNQKIFFPHSYIAVRSRPIALFQFFWTAVHIIRVSSNKYSSLQEIIKKMIPIRNELIKIYCSLFKREEKRKLMYRLRAVKISSIFEIWNEDNLTLQLIKTMLHDFPYKSAFSTNTIYNL